MDIRTLHQIIDEYGIDCIGPEPGQKKLHAAIDELAALRQVAQKVAAMEPHANEHCVFCFAWRAANEHHKPDCPIAVARRLLPDGKN